MTKHGDKPNPQRDDAGSGGVGAGPVAPMLAGDPLDVVVDGELPIDAEVQRHLGLRLKAAYAELVDQPVPDSFLELLAELERKEKSE